jgi:hypothetical protein
MLLPPKASLALLVVTRKHIRSIRLQGAKGFHLSNCFCSETRLCSGRVTGMNGGPRTPILAINCWPLVLKFPRGIISRGRRRNPTILARKQNKPSSGRVAEEQSHSTACWRGPRIRYHRVLRMMHSDVVLPGRRAQLWTVCLRRCPEVRFEEAWPGACGCHMLKLWKSRTCLLAGVVPSWLVRMVRKSPLATEYGLVSCPTS